MAAGGFYHWTGLSVTKLLPSTCVILERDALLFTPSELWHRHYSYLLRVPWPAQHLYTHLPVCICCCSKTSQGFDVHTVCTFYLSICEVTLSLCENEQRIQLTHTSHINRDEVGWLNRLLTRQIWVPPRVLASHLWMFAGSVKHWRTRGPAGLWVLGKCGEDQS